MVQTKLDILSRIFIKSDLITTRAAVGLSSALFSIIALSDFIATGLYLDLYWVIFSFVHSVTVFYALCSSKINRYTFIGEAFFGFLLWNWISISLFLNNHVSSMYTPTGASLAPTVVIGLTTWWILSRYPTIKNKRVTDTCYRAR